jgi:hypothetical protein
MQYVVVLKYLNLLLVVAARTGEVFWMFFVTKYDCTA